MFIFNRFAMYTHTPKLFHFVLPDVELPINRRVLINSFPLVSSCSTKGLGEPDILLSRAAVGGFSLLRRILLWAHTAARPF